ncbi:MAG: hydroxypyruvate isomerase family protein [Halobacteriaceae archaeon]
MELTAYLNLLFDSGSFVERVDRVAEAGYDGVEFFGWDRDAAAIADRCADHGLDLAYMSGERPPLTDPDRADEAVESAESSIDLAAEVGCADLNVKAGPAQPALDSATQRRAVVDTLRRVAPAAEAAGVTLVLEPLNTRVDHPGHFTTTAAEGAELVAAVESPAVKLLFDCYHEQIAHGDVIRSFREHREHVGHVHVADNPGRHEPGTGELNYGNVLAAIRDAGYEGYVGCEFTPTGDPLDALADVKSLVEG